MDIYGVLSGYVEIKGWNVIRLDDLGSLNIAGYDVRERSWRISSEIQELDLEQMTSKTRSGSAYKFTEPGGEMHVLVLNALKASAMVNYTVVVDETLKSLAPKSNQTSSMGNEHE